MQRLGAALTYRDFRVLWFGAFTSTIGTWTQKVAQSWLVLTLAGASSAFYLGLDSFLGELPILLLTIVGGVVADRYDRRRLLLSSQFVQMGSAFTLAALVYFDVIRLWHVLALSVVTGLAQAFGGPAYQSLLPALVAKPHVPNAIAFNAIQFNLARVIGPLVAGAALTAFGMVVCFGLNGLSFLAVIAAILSLRVRHTAPATGSRMGAELLGGVAYVRANPALIGLALLGFATTFLGSPILTFLPLFAREVLHGGVAQYTQLMTFAGAGAVAGALGVAWRGASPHMGRATLVMQLFYGLCVAGFAVTGTFWMNGLLIFGAGVSMVTVSASLSSLVQLHVPNELRGRVMSIYMVAFRGGMPLGSFVAGWLATVTSAPSVLLMNGLVLSLVAVFFLVKGHSVSRL